MKTFIFTGPTLAASEAARILNAEYLPPVGQGDLIGLVHGEKPDVVGIIDGTQGVRPSVWHKEILDALERNVVLFGAGGVGALRAAECDRFGMRGVGRVYRWLKDQFMTRDDEVMCTVDRTNGTFVRTSEPLCNIRATLARAREEGLVDEKALGILLEAAASTFYRKRTFSEVLRAAAENGLSDDIVAALESFVRERYVDVQREDALEMLKTIKESDIDAIRKELSPAGCGSRGHLYRALYNRDRRVAAGRDSSRIPLYMVGNNAALNHPEFPSLQRNAFNRCLVTLLADLLEVRVDDEDVERATLRFRRSRGLKDDGEFETWLRDSDLSEEEFAELMRQEARIFRLHNWLVISRGLEKGTGIILDELRLNDEFRRWKRKAAEDERHLEGRDDEIIETFKAKGVRRLLTDLLAGREGVDPVTFVESVRAAGFDMTTLRYELARQDVLKRELGRKAYDLLFPESNERAEED